VKDGKHEDAEEFLGLYLDALDEELVELRNISTHKPASTSSVEDGQPEVGKRDYTASSVELPISRIFGGRSHSTVRAPSHPDAVTIEAWRSLKLYIQPDSIHTIQDALAHVSQPHPVQVGRAGSSEASQQVLLEALPPVLVLHLERFLYDATADGINKINKPVRFAPELEIPPEIMVPVAGKSAEPVHYKLYGVLYHHGESAGSGHYTVDLLHPNADSGTSGDAWLHINDEDVNVVPHEDVFVGHDNARVDNQCAYMLFYCRITPAWTS
jgi:ubiquitin carboxyl-terminal hydrolase 10